MKNYLRTRSSYNTAIRNQATEGEGLKKVKQGAWRGGGGCGYVF